MNTISVKGQSFTDNFGRERIFNGINFVYKGFAADEDGVIRYKTAITDELMEKLAARGINAVRLGVTWAGIEPECGKYNTEYLDGVREALKICEKHSIYAFIDWHQDLFSYFTLTPGDGAPRWACTVKAEKPREPLLIWAEGYFADPTVHRCFDAFWNNKPCNGRGLQDRYCDMLSFTVNYLKDSPAIMGYDLFNEPFPGTPGGKAFRKLLKRGIATLLFDKRIDRRQLIKDAKAGDVIKMLSVADDSGIYHTVIDAAAKLIYKFDTEKYSPFIRRAAAAVRIAVDSGVIFAENCYYSNLGIPCSVQNISDSEPNFAFSPHGYDLTVDTPLTNVASPYRVNHIFSEHERTQKRLGVPVLVGEWGGMVPGGEEYPALEYLIDKFDRNRWSQTYWHYFKDFENSKICDIISRPVPQAVAGKIKYYGYDRNTKSFALSYRGEANIKAPTLIYLPEKPQKIYSTRSYILKEYGTAWLLQVYAGKGDCVVKAEF